jgi:hypothetical protein
MNVVKTVKTVFKFFILITRRINGSTLFPPAVRRFTIFTDFAVGIIIEAYPVASKASIYFLHKNLLSFILGMAVPVRKV